MSSENIDHIILNGEEYEFTIILSNPDKAIRLPKMLFRTLSITESLMDWEFRGYLDFVNNFEQIERFKADKDKKNSELFYFRMDGTDRIQIYLKPTFSDAQKTTKSRSVENDPIFKNMYLTFFGAIYDTEDLNESTIENKTKRLYFWDADYNKAMELKLPFSSGEYVRKKLNRDPSNMTDADRAVSTGNLLHYIFKEQLEATPSKRWDIGKNNIIYTSPAMFTLNDNIDFILNRHVSDSGFPAVLMRNRFSDKFELVAYDKLFSGYTDQLKERFTFPDNTAQRVSIGPARARRDNVFDFGPFSVMQGYKYDKMAGMDNIKAITTKSVNWYDPVAKQFKVSVSKNTAVTAKNKFKELVVELNASRSTALLPINKTKIQNKAIEHRYLSGAHQTNGDLAVGVCETLRGALFLNDCMSFSAIGMPNRTIGQFIEVYSDIDMQGVWEDRFLGAWLTTGITHMITATSYINEIVAIKPNATENFDVPEDVEG